jgi:hypothetical protein
MMRKLIWWAVIAVTLSVQAGPAQAQTNSWSEPLNLSRSGAAEQPRLIAASNGGVQAFWWDRFDGLTTAYSNGTTWTSGMSAPLDLGEGEMPEFLLDASGRVHAFWQKRVQGEYQLWHASMPMGEDNWAVIELLAEATLGFETLALDDGAVVAVYLRVSQSWGADAGIFLLRLEPGMFVWNAPIDLDTSAYYRLETAETAWLHLAADGEILTVTWREPRSSGYMARTSINGGWTWAGTETLTLPAAEMDQPRSLYWGGGRMLIWQDEGTTGCTLIQRGGDRDWQTGLTGLADCPQDDTSWSAGFQLFWMWGEGSRVINLAAWDGLAWTQPLSISFTFPDPVDNGTRNLQDLRAVQAGGRLYILGSDGVGEIWFVESELGALQLLEAPQPEWGIASRLSSRGMAAAEPALVVDSTGTFHLVWLEGPAGGVFSTLYYANISGEAVGQPVAVKSAAAGEFFRQPALLADPAGWLHLAWSGGTHGEIYYSRVRLEDAENPGAWSPVQLLSEEAGASPQLARDSAGRLYLLYVTPLNEGRGVYLVRSLDQGDAWTQPELVFDAQAADWANLGSAALAIGPSLDGGQTVTIQAAWGEEALPNTLPALGVWYARATTSLVSLDPLQWSDPFEVAGEGAAWPRLLVSGGDVHMVFTVRSLGVWDRRLSLSAASGDVSGWSTAAPAAGWDALQIAEGRSFGVAASGSAGSPDGVLHLVGMPETGRLAYTQWTDGRWGDPESYALAGWNNGAAIWVDAASLPSGGQLGLTWLAVDDSGLPVVFWVSRTIPVEEVVPEPTPMPTPVVESTPGIAPTATIQPSPTPDLNQAPPMRLSSDTPLILGGGLAAIMVVGYMLARRRAR